MTEKSPVLDIPTLTEKDESLPHYGSEHAAGADLKACIEENLVIKAGSSALVSTGLKFELPPGYEIQVRPRSGLALKHQVTVLNTPGTIDADYRGDVGVILINHGSQDFIVTPGMRIAQMILAPVVKANFVKREALSLTARGAGGFGHTGTH